MTVSIPNFDHALILQEIAVKNSRRHFGSDQLTNWQLQVEPWWNCTMLLNIDPFVMILLLDSFYGNLRRPSELLPTLASRDC